jgi:hypothetical protein
VKKGGFVCSVAGKRRGKGSSREQSPYAEMMAGIRVVIAENIERIYNENCQNLGILTSTDFSLIERIRAGEEIPLSGVHRRRGRHHPGDHRVRRTLRVQRGPAPGKVDIPALESQHLTGDDGAADHDHDADEVRGSAAPASTEAGHESWSPAEAAEETTTTSAPNNPPPRRGRG